MDKEFLKSGVIIPAIIAVVVGITGLLFINGNVENISPFTNGEEILYFEELNPSEDVVKGKSAGELKGGEKVGVINSAASMNLRYLADYTNLLHNASISDKGCFPGEVGTCYIEVTNNNRDKLGSEVSFSGVFNGSYKKVEEKTVNNEGSVYLLTPRAKSSVVVFYRMRGRDYGLSSKYRAIIYEEVK